MSGLHSTTEYVTKTTRLCDVPVIRARNRAAQRRRSAILNVTERLEALAAFPPAVQVERRDEFATTITDAVVAIHGSPELTELLDAANHAVMEWRLHGQLTDSCRGLVAAIAAVERRARMEVQ